MRRAAKRDANEPEVIAALEAIGASVQPLSDEDVPDLLVGYRGVNYLFEVKGPTGKLRPGQATWHARWNGQVHAVREAEEAFAVMGVAAAFQSVQQPCGNGHHGPLIAGPEQDFGECVNIDFTCERCGVMVQTTSTRKDLARG